MNRDMSFMIRKKIINEKIQDREKAYSQKNTFPCS